MTIKLTDGNRLNLHVMPTGAKLWRYRYRIDGRENGYAIGEYPTISLQDARSARDDARVLVEQGIHPSHERARVRGERVASNADTFKALAEAWIEKHRGRWSAYYLKQVDRYFARDVYPKIGRGPIRSVISADTLDIIESIAGRGAEAAAINVRQWCSSVFRYTVSKPKADSDPVAMLRRTVIGPPVQHAQCIGEDGINAFLSRLERFGGKRTAVIALHFMPLSWTRTVELRKAQWAEIDLDAKLWTIPKERMKMPRAHLVPLSEQAVALLREIHTISGNGKFLFPDSRRPTYVVFDGKIGRADVRPTVSRSVQCVLSPRCRLRQAGSARRRRPLVQCDGSSPASVYCGPQSREILPLMRKFVWLM